MRVDANMTCTECREWRGRKGRKTPCATCELYLCKVLPEAEEIVCLIDTYGGTFVKDGYVSTSGIMAAMDIEGIKNRKRVYQLILGYVHSHLTAKFKKKNG